MRVKKRKNGFSLVEIMIVACIIAIVLGGGYMIMGSGESAWFTTDANMQLSESLRQSVEKVAKELRESGSLRDYTDPCASVVSMQVAITDGGGAGTSDSIKFSIPIICQAVGTSITTNDKTCLSSCTVTLNSHPLSQYACALNEVVRITQVANWGAPLTWGSAAQIDCAANDYKYIEYRINNNNQLVRRVLDSANALVREDIFAQNIVDFQASLSADQNVVTLTFSAQRKTNLGRTVSASRTVEVYLRNRG